MCDASFDHLVGEREQGHRAGKLLGACESNRERFHRPTCSCLDPARRQDCPVAAMRGYRSTYSCVSRIVSGKFAGWLSAQRRHPPSERGQQFLANLELLLAAALANQTAFRL